MPDISKSNSPTKDTNYCDTDKPKERDHQDVMSLIDSILGLISPSNKQILLGASSGWVTGFLTMKFGKMAALTLGGTIIMCQVAGERGYININWDKVSKRLDNIANKVEERISEESSTWMDKVRKYFKKNTPFTSGFISGFLIGLASY